MNYEKILYGLFGYYFSIALCIYRLRRAICTVTVTFAVTVTGAVTITGAS